jgi:hypothetical protein
LARFATVAKAQAAARLPEQRHMATLLAFVRTLEASAQDDVLDLLDVVVTKLFSDAAAVGKRARLRTIRDLDAAALKLRRAGAVLIDDTIKDAAVREAAFAAVPREAFAAALDQIDLLVRPPGDLYFTELRAQHGKLGFVPALLRTVSFGAAPAGRSVLDAMHHLRAGDGRGLSASAPLDFVPSGWKRQVKARNGSIDKTQPALRGPAARPAVGLSLGSGASRYLPHARPFDRRACRGRSPLRTTGRRLPEDGR